jgi:hypothetical protein
VSLLKQLFGGSEQKQQSTSTPLDMTPDAFKNLRAPFADELTKMLSSGGGPDKAAGRKHRAPGRGQLRVCTRRGPGHPRGS